MPEETVVVAMAVLLSLVFNFVSGFQDPASSIATPIATRALTIPAAVFLLATMNFAGALVSHKVAYTVATGVASPEFVGPALIAAAMTAAIGWTLLVWSYAIPSSSSHALISGLFGAALMKASMDGVGYGSFNWVMLGKIVAALFISPVFGFVAGFMVFRLVTRAASAMFDVVSTQRCNRFFARIQPVSAALMSFSNGSNDAQKTMGLITLALFHGGVIDRFSVPVWVTLACAAAMSLGALAGGLRIIKTIAKKITDIKPIHGFSAEAGSAGVVIMASLAGMPISTTHVAISSVTGVGSSKTTGGVQRKVVLSIIYAWVTTIPASMALAAAAYWVMAKVGALSFCALFLLGLAAVWLFRRGFAGEKIEA